MEDDCPTTDALPLGVMPCAEAMVVLMPVCKAVPMVDPTPAQKEEDNNALVGWTVKCRKFMMNGIASLVLVALGTSVEWLSCWQSKIILSRPAHPVLPS
jgi:hypothetical protein